VNLRRATPGDAEALALAMRRTVRESLAFLPELHTPEEDLAFFSGVVLPRSEVWIADVDDALAGFIALRPGWIDHLYVTPEAQGRGVGSALLAIALEPGRARRLWTFQKNARARGFYEARGFVVETLTDGSGNEEKEPDALYVWRG
jgi:GNAT superfamily N-acetyltransferase